MEARCQSQFHSARVYGSAVQAEENVYARSLVNHNVGTTYSRVFADYLALG